MANARADLELHHQIVNIKNIEEVGNFFADVLYCDEDLHSNGDEYFTEGETGKGIPLCKELGYEDELSMIVGEAMKGKKTYTLKSFEETFVKVFKGLTDQEFWGDTDYDVINLGKGKVAIAYVTGGYNKW